MKYELIIWPRCRKFSFPMETYYCENTFFRDLVLYVTVIPYPIYVKYCKKNSNSLLDENSCNFVARYIMFFCRFLSTDDKVNYFILSFTQNCKLKVSTATVLYVFYHSSTRSPFFLLFFSVVVFCGTHNIFAYQHYRKNEGSTLLFFSVVETTKFWKFYKRLLHSSQSWIENTNMTDCIASQ